MQGIHTELTQELTQELQKKLNSGKLQDVKNIIINQGLIPGKYNIIKNHGNKLLHLALFIEDEAKAQEIVKIILYTQKDYIDENCNIPSAVNDYNTALHIAAGMGRKGIVEILLSKGANINAVNQDGKTALHLATEKGHKETLETLFKKGADITAVNSEGDTALRCAVYCEQEKIVELLLNNGAEINAANQLGDTALHIAVFSNKKGMVELLLNNGAEINAANQLGNTALHIAVFSNEKEILKLLLSRGADTTVKNNDGDTALDMARKEGHQDIIDIFEGTADNKSADVPEATVRVRKLRAAPDTSRNEISGIRHPQDNKSAGIPEREKSTCLYCATALFAIVATAAIECVANLVANSSFDITNEKHDIILVIACVSTLFTLICLAKIITNTQEKPKALGLVSTEEVTHELSIQ